MNSLIRGISKQTQGVIRIGVAIVSIMITAGAAADVSAGTATQGSTGVSISTSNTPVETVEIGSINYTLTTSAASDWQYVTTYMWAELSTSNPSWWNGVGISIDCMRVINPATGQNLSDSSVSCDDEWDDLGANPDGRNIFSINRSSSDLSRYPSSGTYNGYTMGLGTLSIGYDAVAAWNNGSGDNTNRSIRVNIFGCAKLTPTNTGGSATASNYWRRCGTFYMDINITDNRIVDLPCPAAKSSEWVPVSTGNTTYPSSMTDATAIDEHCWRYTCSSDATKTYRGAQSDDWQYVSKGISTRWTWSNRPNSGDMIKTCYDTRCKSGTHRSSLAPVETTEFPDRNGCNKLPCPTYSNMRTGTAMPTTTPSSSNWLPSGWHDNRDNASQDVRRCYTTRADTSANRGPHVKDETKETYGLVSFPQAQFLGGGILTTYVDATNNGAVRGQRFITTAASATLGRSAPTRVFGSWTEYAIVAGGPVTSFASGGAFGYNGGVDSNSSSQAAKGTSGSTDSFGSFSSNNTNGNTYSPISSRNKKGGGLVVNNPADNHACRFSKMTIFNNNCNNATGQVGRNGSDTDVTATKIAASNAQLSRIRDLFKPIGAASVVPAGSVAGINRTGSNATRDNYDKNNARCHNNAINVDSFISLNSGDFVVICSDVAVYINADIVLNEGDYNANTVPQVLIFAPAIVIRDQVSRIDAWLIAEGTTGRVETCTGGTLNDCSARQLVVNGPVFARELRLNRTYVGLKPGTDSAGNRQYGEKDNQKNCNNAQTLIVDEDGRDKFIERDFSYTYNLRNGTTFKVGNSGTSGAGGTCSGATDSSSAWCRSDWGNNTALNTNTPPTASTPTPSSTTTNKNTNTPFAPSTDTSRFKEHTVSVCAVTEPAEIFNLRADAKIWAYSETRKRNVNANINGIQEVLPLW